MRKSLFFIALITLNTVSLSQVYQPNMIDTQWSASQSPISCRLEQKVDDFGTASFEQLAGQPLTLNFFTPNLPSQQGNAEFMLTQAIWQNSDQHTVLAKEDVSAGQNQFTLSGPLAQTALNELNEGRLPSLRYSSQSNPTVIVQMSSIHLADHMPTFQQCLQQLLPYSFEQIQKLTINYEVEQATLGKEEKAALQKLARYVNADPLVTQVRVTGHTDNHGRRRLNEALSDERAMVVKQFLMNECHVKESLITTEHRLEFDPIKSNKTPFGRAYNRRTEIEVIH